MTDTIANCWIKTGILPQNEIHNEQTRQIHEMETACHRIKVEQEKDEETLGSLINNLANSSNIEDPMDARGEPCSVLD